MSTAAVAAAIRSVLSDGDVAAVLAVVGRDPVTPPELTGNAPVLDVLHPMEVNLLKALGYELSLALAYSLDSGLCERLHAYEPLL